MSTNLVNVKVAIGNDGIHSATAENGTRLGVVLENAVQSLNLQIGDSTLFLTMGGVTRVVTPDEPLTEDATVVVNRKHSNG